MEATVYRQDIDWEYRYFLNRFIYRCTIEGQKFVRVFVYVYWAVVITACSILAFFSGPFVFVPIIFITLVVDRTINGFLGGKRADSVAWHLTDRKVRDYVIQWKIEGDRLQVSVGGGEWRVVSKDRMIGLNVFEGKQILQIGSDSDDTSEVYVVPDGLDAKITLEEG